MTDAGDVIYQGVDVLELQGVEYFLHVWLKNGGAETGRTRALTAAQQREQLATTGVNATEIDAWMAAARSNTSRRRNPLKLFSVPSEHHREPPLGWLVRNPFEVVEAWNNAPVSNRLDRAWSVAVDPIDLSAYRGDIEALLGQVDPPDRDAVRNFVPLERS